MIHKINLMGVLIQVEDILFNVDRKEQRKKGCFECGEKGHYWENCPNKATPKKKRGKHQALTSIKTWDEAASEDKVQHRSHGHHRYTSCSSDKCLMEQGNTHDSSSNLYDNDTGSKNDTLYTRTCACHFLKRFAPNKKLS